MPGAEKAVRGHREVCLGSELPVAGEGCSQEGLGPAEVPRKAVKSEAAHSLPPCLPWLCWEMERLPVCSRKAAFPCGIRLRRSAAGLWRAEERMAGQEK